MPNVDASTIERNVGVSTIEQNVGVSTIERNVGVSTIALVGRKRFPPVKNKLRISSNENFLFHVKQTFSCSTWNRIRSNVSVHSNA
jgi:hypothetical protein